MNAISNIYALPNSFDGQRSLSVEIEMLYNTIRDVCPASSTITLCFDGHFNLHVDVQSYEDAVAVEALLPTLADGALRDVRRSGTPHQPFRRRVSALVDL